MPRSCFMRYFTALNALALLSLASSPVMAACSAITGVTTANALTLSFTDSQILDAGDASANAGVLVYDASAMALKFCDGTNWITLHIDKKIPAAGTVTGALQYRDAAGNLTAQDHAYMTTSGLYLFGGPNGYNGWGPIVYESLAAGDLDRSRPNPLNRTAPYRINAHSGLSLSAHSHYGGIKLYNQGTNDTNANAAYLAADGARMVMSVTNSAVGININNPASKLQVNGLMSGGFGALGTDGVTSWNDISNSRPGSGYTLLTGVSTNGHGGGHSSNYFYAFNFGYISLLGLDSLTQFAIPYGAPYFSGGHDGLYIRSRYVGSWGSWRFIPMQAESDYRVKTDVSPLSGGMDRLLSLRPVTYTHILNNATEDGFIAHELAQVLPYAVRGNKDDIDEDGTPRYQNVDYGRLTPIIIGAIQEMKTGNDDLKARLDALETAP